MCKKALIGILLVVFTLSATQLFAEQMTSPGYTIQADSINLAGQRSGSATFFIEDTAGEIATGDSDSTNYKLRAGYQQMTTTYLAMTAASDISMGPAIGGLTGGTSYGTTTTTVTTDNQAGYSLSIKASSSPAMQGNHNGDSVADYTPAGANPDFSFSVAATAAELGFTIDGTDTGPRFLNNGSACNTGSTETVGKCWAALTTSNQVIATRATSNTPSGTLTTINFRLQSGASRFLTADTYTATTTVTALSL